MQMASDAEYSIRPPIQDEVQSFFSSCTFSQAFKDRSPAKTFEHAPGIEEPEAKNVTEDSGGGENSAAVPKSMQDEISILKRVIREKDEVIRRQESVAKQQSIYSYSFLRGLRTCLESCARIIDAETILRAAFPDDANLHQLIDCLTQTILLWLPLNTPAQASSFLNAGVESQVSNAVLLLILLTRNEQHALRVVLKYGVLVWRVMAFLDQPVKAETINTALHQSVLLHAAEVQNGLLNLLQHLVMHEQCCRVLLHEVLTNRQFPKRIFSRTKSVQNRRQCTVKKHLIVALVPVLAPIVWRSNFIRAVELSLVILTTLCMQIELEWSRQHQSKTSVTSKDELVSTSAEIKVIRNQFRLSVACLLTPVNVHRLKEQWNHVMCIHTALDLFADAMQMPKPLSSLVAVRQENGDPDSEVWQQYEFEDGVEKPVAVAVDMEAEPLDVEELDRPISSLMPPESLQIPLEQTGITPGGESNRLPTPNSSDSACVKPSVTITAPRTNVAVRNVQLPLAPPPPPQQHQQQQLVKNAQTSAVVDNSARKRLFYEDEDGDEDFNDDDFDDAVINAIHDGILDNEILKNAVASNEPVCVAPRSAVDDGASGHETHHSNPEVVHVPVLSAPKPPVPMRSVPSPQPAPSRPVQYPLIYRKPMEKALLQARSPPTAAAISFKNGGGNRNPSQKERGSQDIRKFMQPRSSAALSPAQVLENRQKRNAVADLRITADTAPRSPATISTAATRGSYYNSNTKDHRMGRYAVGNFSGQLRGSGKKKAGIPGYNNKRWREAQVVSPVHLRIVPPKTGANLQPAEGSPAGFQPFEGFPAELLGGADDAGNDIEWNGHDETADDEMSNSLHNSASNSNEEAVVAVRKRASHSDSFDLGDDFTQKASLHAIKPPTNQVDDADICLIAAPKYIPQTAKTGFVGRLSKNSIRNDTQVIDLEDNFSQFFTPSCAIKKVQGKTSARPTNNVRQVVLNIGSNNNERKNLGVQAQHGELVRPIPVNYEVSTVYDVDDSNSRSSDIVPSVQRAAPQKAFDADQPLKVAASTARLFDDSDDAVQVLLENFRTQDLLPSAGASPVTTSKVGNNNYGWPGRGGGSARGCGASYK